MKKNPKSKANPDLKPAPHRPDQSPSSDSRDGHGLSKDEVLKGKE